MLLRKGVFPYDWCNSLEKLDEMQLPPKEAFHSKLIIPILQMMILSTPLRCGIILKSKFFMSIMICI